MLRFQVCVYALDLQITTPAACRTHIITFGLSSATYLTGNKGSLPRVSDSPVCLSLRCRYRCLIMGAFGHCPGVAGVENVSFWRTLAFLARLFPSSQE